MNAGAIVAVIAAAAAQKARQDAEDAFRLAGATSPERARSLAELGLTANPAVLGTLRSAGIIRGVGGRGQVLSLGSETDAAAWYLDEAAILAERSMTSAVGKRKTYGVLAVAIAVLLLLIGFMLIAQGGRGL
jgi:hypothetical protein